MSDRLKWWRHAVQTPNIRDRWPIDLRSPEQGWYRFKRKGVWEPIAYWWEDEALFCLIGKDEWFAKEEDEHITLAIEAWPHVSKHPISEEEYDEVIAGGQWRDLDGAVADQMEAGTARGVGDNRPPLSEIAQYNVDVENAAAAVERYKVIEDDETNAKAQSARARLNELASQADKKREIEKAPSLKEGRDIDAKWGKVIKAARSAAETIRAAMKAWENKKFREQEAKRIEEEKRQREQAEEEQRAADAAIAQGVPPAVQVAPPSPPPPPPPAPAQIRGGYGRAASVPTVIVYTVTDQDAFYAAVKFRGEVAEFFAAFAKREAKQNRVHPGVTISQEKDVR
jgi:hypothetical protein